MVSTQDPEGPSGEGMSSSSLMTGQERRRGKLALNPAGGANRAHSLVERGRVKGGPKGMRGTKGSRAPSNTDSCR